MLSARQFREALAEAWRDERHALIEVSIPKGDISIVLRRFVDAMKTLRGAALRPSSFVQPDGRLVRPTL